MRRLLLGIAAVAISLCTVVSPAAAQAPDKVGCYERNPEFQGSHVSKAGPFQFGEAEAVDLPSNYDGVDIQLAYIRPDAPAGHKAPVILFASPYLGEDLHDRCSLNTHIQRLAENYVPHGYAIGVLAVRGTANAGGCSDLMGKAERSDLDQAVTWFGTQPWSNGNVGMLGVSYDGSTPWEVAASGNPHLKTIIPISGVNDVWHLMYHSGVSELRGRLVLNALYWLYGFQESNPVMPDSYRSPEHTVEGVVCPEAFKGFAVSMHAAQTGERDPLGYWAERNSRPGVEKNYKGSIFMVHGLQDWNVDPAHAYPWVNELEAKGTYVQHMLPQWGHAYPDVGTSHEDNFRADWGDVLLDWFDHWLKEEKVDLGPRVQVQDSAMQWREDDRWPPRGTDRTLFLSPDSTLQDAAPADTGEVVLAPDPRNQIGVEPPSGTQAPCVGCASFSLPLEKGLRFAGIPKLKLRVTPGGPGGYVGAWLYQVKRGETAERTRVGWGATDLRFPDGGETASIPTPGEPMDVTLPIEPLDVAIPSDADLELVIAQVDYGDHVPTVPTYPIVLHTGADSSIQLHTHEPAACQTFKPDGAFEAEAAPTGLRPFGTLADVRSGRPRLTVGSNCARPVVPGGKPVPVDAPPTSKLTPIRKKLTAKKLRAISGTAADDRGVSRVEVALARRSGSGCAFMAASGRFGKPRPCGSPVFLKAFGTTSWTLRLRKRVRAGRYVVSWRAFDVSGQPEAGPAQSLSLRLR